MGSGERKRSTNMAPVRTFFSLAWIKARRLPGVRCSTEKTTWSWSLCLIIMPGRICVAGIDIRKTPEFWLWEEDLSDGTVRPVRNPTIVSQGLAAFCMMTPWDIREEKMSHLEKEKQKLVARIKRIRGQVDSIERSLTGDDDCADILMLLANVRGGINSLMAEVLEDHIRLHLLASEKSLAPPHELAEDLIDLVRAYLK